MLCQKGPDLSDVVQCKPARSSSVMYTAPVTPRNSHEADASVNFDVCRYLKLVPPFRKSEVDAYFVTFERIAMKLF